MGLTDKFCHAEFISASTLHIMCWILNQVQNDIGFKPLGQPHMIIRLDAKPAWNK